MKSATISDWVNDAVFPMKKLDEKEKVLEFMRKPVPFCATAGHFEDAITGEPVEDRSWPWYRRSGWQWSDRDIYHVEKHDLELDPEFVAYALSHLNPQEMPLDKGRERAVRSPPCREANQMGSCPAFRTYRSIGERLCCTQTICPAPSVPKLTEKQGPNLPGAGSRDISWMLPSKPAVPGTARRERGP